MNISNIIQWHNRLTFKLLVTMFTGSLSGLCGIHLFYIFKPLQILQRYMTLLMYWGQQDDNDSKGQKGEIKAVPWYLDLKPDQLL